MATQQVEGCSTPTPSVSTIPATANYTCQLAIVTTLFFIWGFLTCLNAI
jgi:fucose permease